MLWSEQRLNEYMYVCMVWSISKAGNLQVTGLCEHSWHTHVSCYSIQCGDNLHV